MLIFLTKYVSIKPAQHHKNSTAQASKKSIKIPAFRHNPAVPLRLISTSS